MKNTIKPLLAIFITLLSLTQIIAQNKGEFSEVTFSTEDNLKINAVLQYPKESKTSSPAIILIHQGGSSKEEWTSLPVVQQLIKEGYAILAYDIRIHGKSEKDDGNLYDLFNNPKRAPLDLVAAIQFLKKDKHINPNRIGVMGASIGANLACIATSNRFKAKSIVSISAKIAAAQNLSGSKEIIAPKNGFYIASEKEQGGKRAEWAHDLYNKTSGERKVEIGKGNAHGVHILKQNKFLEKSIVEWFKKTL